MKIRFFEWNERTALLILTSAALLFNLPFFNHQLWPQHDTIYAYQNFYTFYQQYFYHNELVRWYPYGTYGINADLTQLFNLAPSAYFTGVVGKLLHIRNAMFLFKFSLLIEELLFLIGFFLLARRLFTDSKIVFLTSLMAIGSTAWYIQVYWNFRIYYLFPLIVYFFMKFMEERKGYYFWTCGIVFLCSFIGNLPYFTILYLPIFAILLVAFLLIYRSFPWAKIFELNKKNLAVFLICIFIGISYALFASRADDGIISYQKGRDPVHHSLDINTFLTNGSGIGFEKFLGFFFEVSHENFTVYIGWLTILFLFYGILKVRSVPFYGILLCGVFLALFSTGDSFPLARPLYHFLLPMKWFQYIGQIVSFARIFFVLAAGFGLDHFLNRSHSKDRRLILGISVLIMITFIVLSQVCSESIPWKAMALRLFYIAAFIVFIVGSSALIKLRHSAGKASLIIGVFLLLDFTPYHFALASAWHHPATIQNPSTYEINPDQYQPTRILPDEFRHDPRRIMVDQNPIERLAIDALNFIEVDPCTEIYPSLLVPENVWRYLEIRANYKRIKNQKGFRAEWTNSVPFFYEIGCHVAKLRLVESALIASSEILAEQLVRSNNDLGVIVILDQAGQSVNPRSSDAKRLGSVQVTNFSYNRIELTVNALNPDGAWLYYADTYHPDWKATINNQPTFIYPANIAFKALRVPAGVSQVSFSFNHGKANLLAWVIALVGFFFVLLVFVLFAGSLRTAAKKSGGPIRRSTCGSRESRR